jgi:hypothetical protein
VFPFLFCSQSKLIETMKNPFASILLLVLLAPTDGRKLHGLVAERDWSKTAHRFDLHRHLKTPTTRDRLDGVEGSRRLARNAIRLGTDEQIHRELVPDNPPTGIVEEFDPDVSFLRQRTSNRSIPPELTTSFHLLETTHITDPPC